MENTVAVVVRKGGKFLLTLRAHPPEKGRWAVPGGHVDAGETIHQAAVRECREEVGDVEVEKEPFLVFEHPFGSPDHMHRCHTFMGRARGKISAGSDAEKAEWFAPDEMKGLNLAGYTKTIFRKKDEKNKAPGED